MRLWSLHPQYLDPQGLVALWREALLARAVLKNLTRGYRNHPQLERFRLHRSPVSALEVYLWAVYREAALRGYAFDHTKLGAVGSVEIIPVTTGQLAYEWNHLLRKLADRSPALHEKWRRLKKPECHPLFRPRTGPIAPWEKVRLPNPS